ncbi:MAG TPA: Na+/H+ antiporter subunit E [bacterium]|nr:Na+/H+ antiporter subunit E [bacterium]
MKKLVLSIVSLVVWILLVWPFSPDGIDYQSLFIGIIASGIVGLFFGDAFTESPHKFFEPRRYFWLICFVFVFAAAFIDASIDFAWRVLHPSLPIKPGIIKVRTSLKRKSAIAILANCMGFAPGAVTVEIGEDGILYIHMACIKHFDKGEITPLFVRKFERILKGIFE